MSENNPFCRNQGKTTTNRTIAATDFVEGQFAVLRIALLQSVNGESFDNKTI
jgi:hypothetical protein